MKNTRTQNQTEQQPRGTGVDPAYFSEVALEEINRLNRELLLVRAYNRQLLAQLDGERSSEKQKEG